MLDLYFVPMCQKIWPRILEPLCLFRTTLLDYYNSCSKVSKITNNHYRIIVESKFGLNHFSHMNYDLFYWYHNQNWYGNHCVKIIQIRSFFLVLIFPYSDWIRRDTPYLVVFSPNAGKYRPGKTPYLDTVDAVNFYLVFGLATWSSKDTCFHFFSGPTPTLEDHKALFLI